MYFLHKQKKAFTLIELMVSVAIFTFVMVIALGGLLSVSAAERKAETLKSVMNNLNFALESMSREMRTGSDFGCPTIGTDCNAGGAQITFKSADTGNPTYTYCLSAGSNYSACNTGSGAITCPTGAACAILRQKTGTGAEAFTPLTAPEVIISSLAFYVFGDPSGDSRQPKITMLLTGFVRVSGTATTQAECSNTGNKCSAFNLQTTVTQRLYDQ
jgi:prepilin-type N-terminal cleavage/methylation domain-containing protein